MDYLDLKRVANQRKLRVKDLAESVGSSENGFKVSIDNGTMAFSKIPDLCHLLGLTPNEFYGWESSSNIASNGSVQAVGNNIYQHVGEVKALKDLVQLLREQVKEKDSQINALLKIAQR